MFKNLIKGLLTGLAVKLLDSYRHLSLQLLKIEAARCYVDGVRMARVSAIGLMQMGLLISLIGLGVLLAHAGLFVLLPWTVETKALLSLFLGLAYVIAGGVALRAAMDEQTWLDKSGATKMLNDVIGPSAKNES
jgi:hypothetical protein